MADGWCRYAGDQEQKGPNVEIELVITCFGDSECEKMVNTILKKIKEIILKLGGNIGR